MATGPAVIFDVDGTLVDTNWFHTLSWWRALRAADRVVPMSRIQPLIGMGSDALLTALFGEETEGLSQGHTEQFKSFMPEITAFPRAADLIGEVSKRGAKVVLATASKESELKVMLEAIGADDHIDEIFRGDQVEASKPAPDVFITAVESLELDRSNTLVVGDSRWDLQAAAAAGLRCVAVLTGGTTRRDLEDAGAIAVFDDVADLLEKLDESPLGRILER